MKEKYSIWGMLSEESRLPLSNAINLLSKSHGGPAFLPHITILGDVTKPHQEMIDSIQVISEKHESIQTNHGNIEWSLEYFKALFINILANSQLTTLRRNSEKIVSVSETLFSPHISLMYGSYEQRLLEEARLRFNNQLPNHSLIKSVSLVPITPNPSDWEIIKEFNLLP